MYEDEVGTSGSSNAGSWLIPGSSAGANSPLLQRRLLMNLDLDGSRYCISYIKDTIAQGSMTSGFHRDCTVGSAERNRLLSQAT